MIAKLPLVSDVTKMFNCGIMKIEATLEDELFITDMLSRKKYRLDFRNVTGELNLILIEQE